MPPSGQAEGATACADHLGVRHHKRDFVWLFSRQPQMDQTQLARYTQLMQGWGYDVSKLKRVPQQWPNPADGSLPLLGPHRE